MGRPTSASSKYDMEKDHTADEQAMGAWPNTEDDEIERTIEEAENSDLAEEHQNEKSKQDTPNALVRIITGKSTASSWKDPGPPPDGGMQAWIQVFCCHLCVLNTFGFFTSFGVYQTYYQNSLGIESSTISWIGSVQAFLLFGIGTFTGRATDAGLFRHVYIAGAVFQIIGIFTMAESTKFWQLFLSQAVCIGIGNGLQFCPSMALVSTYFARKRAFAVGITALGSCTGGIIFPIVVQQLLPKVGFAWTIRVIGFIMLALHAISIALYRTRLPPRKSGALVDWASFREAPYALYCIAMFFNFWGLYFTFFYIGAYGRNVLGVSYQQSINLLLTIVCMGFIFRLLPNYFADRLGTLNTLIPFAFLSGIMMFAWIGIHSVGGLFAFAAIYGSGSAVTQALWPAMFGSLSKVPDLKKAGVRMGMAFTVVSVACLTGPPLAGALIQQNGGNYLHAQLWAGISFFIGGTLLIATRFAKVGWDWRARI